MENPTGGARRRITALLAVLALAAAMSLAACGSSDDSGDKEGGGIGGGSASKSGSGTLKIGLLSTLEGPFAPFGEAANQGAKVALLEYGG